MMHFFGDRERDFVITFPLVAELERTTGAGIGEIFRRVFAGTFRHVDLCETIRIAMIGGGTSPKDASHLCETYLPLMSLAERQVLAVSILEALYGAKAAQ